MDSISLPLVNYLAHPTLELARRKSLIYHVNILAFENAEGDQIKGLKDKGSAGKEGENDDTLATDAN
jgi:hypothetical protein